MASSGPERQARLGRFRLLAAVALSGFGIVVLGLLRLQVVEHDRYVELSKENRVRLEVLRAPRGAIYDRNGKLLADSAPSFTILFRPFPAESAQRAALTRTSRWIAQVASLVGQDTTEIRHAVAQSNRSGRSAVLMRDVPFKVLAGVEESKSELPGIEIQVEPLRRYAHGILAAHLLGYAGEINEVELDSLSDEGYQSGDLIGRTGVEHAYEQILRGRDGAEYVVVNAMGKRVSALAGEPPRLPVPGHDLVLTLDLDLQRDLEEAMVNVKRGAAVAIDPQDGGVLAMVSRPAYDPNEFSHGLTFQRWGEMSQGGENPLLNRAIQGVYPPGSTFKIVTMMAGLRAAVVRRDTHLAPCLGRYQFGGRSFGCWNPRGHGSLDLIGAIENSCDVYFYQLGLTLGLDRLERAARDFGLGDYTGVDLPQERRGLIPSSSWYDQHWGAGKWRKGVLLNLAIGQGELLVTPIQLAMMSAEVANDGRPIRPHVVREIRGMRDYQFAKPGRGAFEASPEAWQAVHDGLKLVVDAGTGMAARVPGIGVAGKTGSAQNPHGQVHALFVCYAPTEHPTIAMAFVIENAGHGGSVAAPFAGAVFRRMFVHDSTHVAVPLPRSAARDTNRVPADTSGAGDAD